MIDDGPLIINEPIDAIGVASSTLGARIIVADQILGYLFVESAVHGFYTAGHADRLGAIADQAGAAVSNARLAERVSELAAADERQRLAHELHDAVSQTLWTAALTAESLLLDVEESSPLRHRVSRLHQSTRGAVSEMRALLLELRPSDLIEVRLADLVNFLLTALECRRRLVVDVAVDDVELPPDAHLAFYRIAQEALRNVTHHADATKISVRLTAGPLIELSIADDGRGFDAESVPKGHFGIAIMRERAESIGAGLRVTSHAWRGNLGPPHVPAPGRGMSIGASISVVVIDDHDLLREGVTACLAANLDIVVIGEATSGESAVSMAASHEPDVVVIDLVMPGLGGVGAIRQIRAAHPTMAILALSSFYERDRVHEVLDAGADGYLVKSVDAESLAHAVRSVARGQGAFSPEVTRGSPPTQRPGIGRWPRSPPASSMSPTSSPKDAPTPRSHLNSG